jgi:molybdopterin-guanine dinucleotide biosynthesis protein A
MHQKNNHLLTKHQESIGIYGTSCDEVKTWVEFFQESAEIPTGYLDAAHSEVKEFSGMTKAPGMVHFQIPGEGISPWTFHWVNGNHYPAQRQIIIHNTKKLESLERRKDELLDVALVIAEGGIPGHLRTWGVINEDTVCIDPSHKTAIAAWVKEHTQPSPLAVLILTGGQSERMGIDKAMLNYHGMPQWQYLMQEAEKLGLPTFLSVKDFMQIEQRNLPEEKCITDQWLDIGPLGAILSATKRFPQFSWMVMACDMPDWGYASMKHLMKNRNAKKLATAFWNSEKQWAEPLATIWERDATPWLAMWTTQSHCARKLLARLPIASINPLEENWLQNINLPQEREAWIKRQVE